MSLTPQQIENEIKKLQTRNHELEQDMNHLRNKNYTDYWKLNQKVEGHETVLSELRSNLDPILSHQIYDPYFLSDQLADIVENKSKINELYQLVNYNMSKIDSLEISIDSLKESIVKIGIDAEAVGKALKEISEKLKEIAPAGDNQKDRVPDEKDNLEIFNQIEPNKSDSEFLEWLNDMNNYFYREEEW